MLASEILDEEEDAPTRHSSLEGPYYGRSTLRKRQSNRNKVRVKQVKFHTSVARGQGQGHGHGQGHQHRPSSPTPSLQFQLHPAPKDLPESPPPPPPNQPQNSHIPTSNGRFVIVNQIKMRQRQNARDYAVYVKQSSLGAYSLQQLQAEPEDPATERWRRCQVRPFPSFSAVLLLPRVPADAAHPGGRGGDRQGGRGGQQGQQ